MESDIRWKQRFENYKNALNYLVTDIQVNEEFNSDTIKIAVIKDFEMTHELAWKLMKDILQDSGHTEIWGSKIASRMAFNIGLITDGDIWLEMVESRNITVHAYDNLVLSEQFDKIKNLYLPLFIQFKQRIEKLCRNSG